MLYGKPEFKFPYIADSISKDAFNKYTHLYIAYINLVQ